MKAVDVLGFALFCLCAVPFFISFGYMLRANFYLCGRVASGELGWNPFLWGRVLRHDAFFMEMQRRARRWLLIYIAAVALLMIVIAIVVAMLSFFGVIQMTPSVQKPAAPTKITPFKAPRVLAKPISRENAASGAVLK